MIPDVRLAPGWDDIMMRRLLQPLWILLAIIFLIEAWLWDHLEPIVAAVCGADPLHTFKQWLAERVDSLSPAMTLIVFIVPVIPLFPLKLVGFWLLAHEYWISAILTIIFAKFLGVGVAAFIFDVTRPKLLEMAWFEKLYEFVLALRAKAHGAGRAGQGAHPRHAARQWRGLVVAHAAPDPALPQKRARSAVNAVGSTLSTVIACEVSSSRTERRLNCGRSSIPERVSEALGVRDTPLRRV